MKQKLTGPMSAVDDVFQSYPRAARAKLGALRKLILATAARTQGVGEIEETLKWGQPSYLTKSKSSTTIRIDRHGERHYALFVRITEK